MEGHPSSSRLAVLMGHVTGASTSGVQISLVRVHPVNCVGWGAGGMWSLRMSVGYGLYDWGCLSTMMMVGNAGMMHGQLLCGWCLP